MTNIDPYRVVEIIQDVTERIILPRHQNLSDSDIHEKTSPTDLVTIADLEAEEELTKIFLDILPGSYVVGEEAVSKEQVSTDILQREDETFWVIDPVDGTNNFASGDKRFGVIVSLVKNGQVIQGWIWDPLGHRMGVAELGGGVEINKVKRHYPLSDKALKETRGFISRKFLPQKFKETIKETLETEFGEITPYLCCAHEYLDILDGGAFYSMYSRIKPWDHLAGAFMLIEAGGYVRKWDKTAYAPSDSVGGLLNAANEEKWQEIHDHLIARFI